MGVARLRAELSRHRRIAVDTNVFIYEMEENARYLDLADVVFEWLEDAAHIAVTSTLTMTEILVYPYRRLNEQAVAEYYSSLATISNLEWIPPTLPIADLAARLRTTSRIQTPDAIQAATALYSGCDAMVTNDKVFRQVMQLKSYLLEDFIPKP